ncbi:TraI domain-containing protein [Acidovorax sp. SUPP950]|uniref:MobH family relaxase n=1 Tax=Acidovorax sp. SUPP950 TaxID=511901 RepID=UPI0023BFD535|nr:MobH family relaxase [Acidovorax sp. SUPP950]GKS73225.1 TraI domain-containing protein [Acidovorax sp. SUPP950]
MSILPWGRASADRVQPKPLSGAAPGVAAAEHGQADDGESPFPPLAGTQPGWLRVLGAEQLLATVQASKAIQEIWRKSCQSRETWERDLLPAIHRYAEFVQLMPASEAHHHAHAGGLLSHTIEMLLAAMTWRNAHLLPGGSEIEEIDAQRDQWTYVVFFAALLHDIAKPMTDLRIQWRCDGMADSIRWAPTGGSLVQIAGRRPAAEYLVDFAPKSQREYGAHARLAQLLLPRIAPESALQFLAYTPTALDALEKYLSAQDKESLVAQIVRRADKLSTQRALLSGHKARFSTAKAVPLIDLLMQAITSMLRSGSTLPLNRSGAAGWVYDGAVWFVAKRLADTVREWIKTHEPDEAVPGDAKNDRLFDTWQEYGAIELNPATGQAIWYVTVNGNAEEGGEASEQGAYVHELAMLRFPLAKLFPDASKYPALMRGHLQLRERRKGDAAETATSARVTGAPAENEPSALPMVRPAAEAGPATAPLKQASDAAAAKPDSKPAKLAAVLREPAFNKPKTPKPATGSGKPREAAPASGSEPVATSTEPKRTSAMGIPNCTSAPNPPQTAATGTPREDAPILEPAKPVPIASEEAAYLIDDSDFLDPMESAAALKRQKATRPVAPPATRAAGAVPAQVHETGPSVQPPSSRHPTPRPAPRAAKPAVASPASMQRKAPLPRREGGVSAEFRRMAEELDDLPEIMPRTAQQASAAPPAAPEPVLLVQQLPRLASGNDKPAHEPSELAIAFLRWIQERLVSRDLTYNEPGAAVHFVEQGMALVSPLIFKMYAREVGDETDAQELGTRVQREVIKCGWHMPGPNRTNIVRFAIHSRGSVAGHLSCVVLVEPSRWVQPVPPSNPVLKVV